MKESVNRSPLFYVGDKYKLVSEIKTHFPPKIRLLAEPFVGGGSVFLNIEAERYELNDIDSSVIRLHRWLCSYAGKESDFFGQLFDTIEKAGLSCTYLHDDIPDELKAKYKKTYIAKYNRDAFYRLRADYNSTGGTDDRLLYILLIYGFNRMLRFNSRREYNLPVGNVDFNANTYKALADYLGIMASKKAKWHNSDFRKFISGLDLGSDDLLYLDPPYLITFSQYNKDWDEQSERDLLEMLNDIDRKGKKFAISNVTRYKGRVNNIFAEWATAYHTHTIKSNYISFHDNTVKQFDEVLVTNY